MAITQSQIAKMLNVDKSTVSRALNSKEGVNPEMKETILLMAHKYGYNGKRKRYRKSEEQAARNICFVASSDIDFNSDVSFFYPLILSTIQKEAANKGYQLTFNYAGNAVQEKMLFALIADKKTDGLILVGRIDIELITRLLNTGIPMVGLDVQQEINEIDNVLTDNIWGAKKAVEYLIQLGHRDIACTISEGLSFKQRFTGFRLALDERGITVNPNYLVKATSNKIGPEELRKLISSPKPPTAIFACNDPMARSAINFFLEQGLKVPQDISVLGFDDDAAASITAPPLSTVRVAREQMARLAFAALHRRIRGEALPPSQIISNVELIVRRSTDFPRN
jgi:LacI family transcriptional regulator